MTQPSPHVIVSANTIKRLIEKDVKPCVMISALYEMCSCLAKQRGDEALQLLRALTAWLALSVGTSQEDPDVREQFTALLYTVAELALSQRLHVWYELQVEFEFSLADKSGAVLEQTVDTKKLAPPTLLLMRQPDEVQ